MREAVRAGEVEEEGRWDGRGAHQPAAASSNADSLCSMSSLCHASSFGHGLATGQRPKLGAELPVEPRGPGAAPVGGPAMPGT